MSTSINKIFLIIQREYLSRVKKKSFIIMTFVGPLLAAVLLFLPIYLAKVKDPVYNISIVDETGLFVNNLPETDNIKFQFVTTNLNETKKELYGSDNYSILYIPLIALNASKGVMLLSEKQPNQQIINYLENLISKGIEKAKLRASGIDPKILASIKANVNINTIKLTAKGEEDNNSDLATKLSFAGGLLIYVFIFIYGAQVMRGVIEEKSSRIVEVIISSVRPFQLMMGKIVGIALVSLTQFLLWIILTSALTSFVGSTLVLNNGLDASTVEKVMKNPTTIDKGEHSSAINGGVNELLSSMDSINFPLIGGLFIFYFLGGYLLYGAFFAAIGAAVDSETDTQQFMLPLTIPLILSFLMAQVIISNPEGSIAFWFSIIPLTSPVVMMLRIPFGVPTYEIFISMSFLILGFVLATWLAAKIYRTGILMYGKKVSYKEIGKWLFYKE